MLFFKNIWEPLIGFSISTAFILTLLLFRLGSLVPGFSTTEIATFNASNSLHTILNNPVNAPYKLIHLLLIHYHLSSPFYLRSVSVFFAIITIILFYYVLSRWHTVRIAWFGTILLATSSLFLHYARLAEPAITSTLLIGIFAYGLWLKTTKKPKFAFIIGTFLILLLLYIPGLIWFVIAGCIWRKKQLISLFKQYFVLGIGLSILGLLLLAPLGYGLYKNPFLIRQIVGLPTQFIPSIYGYIKNITDLFISFIIRGPSNPVVWLARLPLLDIFTFTMCIAGIFVVFSHRQLDRKKMLFGSIVGGILLTSLDGEVSIAILIPFIYILASSGITMILQQWFTVYPRNPIARTLGTSIITIAVLMTCFYQVNNYFIAWPNAPETKQAFQIKH